MLQSHNTIWLPYSLGLISSLNVTQQQVRDNLLGIWYAFIPNYLLKITFEYYNILKADALSPSTNVLPNRNYQTKKHGTPNQTICGNRNSLRHHRILRYALLILRYQISFLRCRRLNSISFLWQKFLNHLSVENCVYCMYKHSIGLATFILHSDWNIWFDWRWFSMDPLQKITL